MRTWGELEESNSRPCCCGLSTACGRSRTAGTVTRHLQDTDIAAPLKHPNPRRLAEWSLWLEERLLAPVTHRQVVPTVPKRLRAYFIYDRRPLSLLSRVAYRTLRDYLRAALGEREAPPAEIVCIQSFGALVHSEFGAPLGPPIAGADRPGLLRVARYGARAPVAESRLRYPAERAEIERV